MRVPNDNDCRNILDEMDTFSGQLIEWEVSFLESNEARKTFTDRQREIIMDFADKYELKFFH